MEINEPKLPLEAQRNDNTISRSGWSDSLRGTNRDVFGRHDHTSPGGQDDDAAPSPEGPINSDESAEDSPPRASNGRDNDPPEPPTPPSPGTESPDGNEEDFNLWIGQVDRNQPYITVNERDTLAISEEITPVSDSEIRDKGGRIEIGPASPLIVTRTTPISSEIVPGNYAMLVSSGDTVAALNLSDGDINPETTAQDLTAVSSMFSSITNFGPGTEIVLAAPSDPRANALQAPTSGGLIELQWSRGMDPNTTSSNLEHLKHTLSQHFSGDNIRVISQGEIQDVAVSPDGITHVLAHSRESNVSRIISRQHATSTDEKAFGLQIPYQNLNKEFITESARAAAASWIAARGHSRIANQYPRIDHMLDNRNFVRPELTSFLQINDKSYSADARIDRVTGVMDVGKLPDSFNPRDTEGLDPGANLVERLIHVARDLGCKQITIPTTHSKFLDSMAMRRVQRLTHIKIPTISQLTQAYDANAKRFGFNKMDADQEKHRKDL